MNTIPQGFERLEARNGFMRSTGPLWLCRSHDQVSLGFLVERRHTNGIAVCHGGMLATFCDILLPLAARSLLPGATDRFMLTVSLQIDYIAPARLGTWVEGRAELLEARRDIVFIHASVTADNLLVARASGLLKSSRSQPVL